MTRSVPVLKATFLLATLWMVTLALAAPRPVLACGPEYRCGSEFYYFSDASHTVLVGIRGWDCNPCTGYSSGKVTNFSEWYPQPCCSW